MEKRTEEILLAVIREHIKTAQPVGSEVLQAKYKFGVSSATIRNELACLERDGFINQPHTSAGRIPTIKGYSTWISTLKSKKLSQKDIDELNEFFSDLSEDGLKIIAKELARMANTAVFWAFHRRHFYHTGLSNFLTQPEFVGSNLIYDVSSVVDRMEDIIWENFDHWHDGVEILIGENNPFSNLCSAIVLKYRNGSNISIVGLLAPLRQDYERNAALMSHLESKLK
jgi:transcriptional regulator of heat shock response